MDFETNNHSAFVLHYHLVICTKYRYKVINDDIGNRLKEIFEFIAPKYNITLEEWNHDTDHVHILFGGQSQTEIINFATAYKAASSRLIKKEYARIRESLWKKKFWSESYCLVTSSRISAEIIKHYMQMQKKSMANNAIPDKYKKSLAVGENYAGTEF